MSSLQIQQVLGEMRALQARVDGATGGRAAISAAGAPDAHPSEFAQLLKRAAEQMATLEDDQATSMAVSCEAGGKNIDAARTMLEVQKASQVLHAMAEVRNKLIDAYTTVMSMPV